MSGITDRLSINLPSGPGRSGSSGGRCGPAHGLNKPAIACEGVLHGRRTLREHSYRYWNTMTEVEREAAISFYKEVRRVLKLKR